MTARAGYYHNVSTFPNETERVELAKKVRSAAPSCSHYTGYHVYRYFANLRHRAKNGFEPGLPSDGAFSPNSYVLSACVLTVAGATNAAVVVAAKALDTPQCEETRPSRKAAKWQKQSETSDGRTSAPDAKCHSLHKTVQHSSASVVAEDELGKEVSNHHKSACMRTSQLFFTLLKPSPSHHPSLPSLPIAKRRRTTRVVESTRPRRRTLIAQISTESQRTLRCYHRYHPLQQDKTTNLGLESTPPPLRVKVKVTCPISYRSSTLPSPTLVQCGIDTAPTTLLRSPSRNWRRGFRRREGPRLRHDWTQRWEAEGYPCVGYELYIIDGGRTEKEWDPLFGIGGTSRCAPVVLQGPVPGPVWDRPKDRDRPQKDRTGTAKISVLSLVPVPVLRC